nr:hypothetical protein CFP56_56462 [Quercus suber]
MLRGGRVVGTSRRPKSSGQTEGEVCQPETQKLAGLSLSMLREYLWPPDQSYSLPLLRLITFLVSPPESLAQADNVSRHIGEVSTMRFLKLDDALPSALGGRDEPQSDGRSARTLKLENEEIMWGSCTLHPQAAALVSRSCSTTLPKVEIYITSRARQGMCMVTAHVYYHFYGLSARRSRREGSSRSHDHVQEHAL